MKLKIERHRLLEVLDSTIGENREMYINTWSEASLKNLKELLSTEYSPHHLILLHHLISVSL